MFDTLSRVLIFFTFIGAGALLARLKLLSLQGLDGLSAYFYWLGFPCWLLISFSQLTPPPGHMVAILAAYALVMILCAGLVVFLARLARESMPHATAGGVASFVNNSAFMGIPIATSLFGAEVAKTGPLIVATDFLILFTIGCAALAKASGHTFHQALLRTCQNPTVIGALLGVSLMVLHWPIPPAAAGALELMGRSGPPVALVALGGMLGLMPVKTLLAFNKTSFIAIFGKILLAPALVAAVMGALHVDPETFRIVVFMSACPTAVSVFIQSKVYGVWFEGAATTVAQSTLFSLATLSCLALVLA